MKISIGVMVSALAGMVGCAAAPVQAQWPQWGGPDGNFVVPSGRLADKWSEAGPPMLWKRELGDGYSAIAVDAGTLLTTYRTGGDEVVIAIDAATGKTKWEYAYSAPVGTHYEDRFGLGPHATPLVAGEYVYTLGFTAKLHCLDKRTGQVVWSKDTETEWGVTAPRFGSSASPILYQDRLLVVLGGKDNGIAALSPKTGDVIWKRHSFENTYSSPVIVHVGGQDQIALLVSDKIVGLDPENGDLLWAHEHVNQWKTNISTPVFAHDGTLYVSSSGDAGSRMLKLGRKEGKTTVEELWISRKMQVGQGNAIRVADRIFGSAGGNTSFIGASDARTGKVAWRQRGFSKATMIYADGKLIILDEDGVLAIARPQPDRLEVLSKFQLFHDRSWSVPTLIGKKLYVRNQKRIVALDLG